MHAISRLVDKIQRCGLRRALCNCSSTCNVKDLSFDTAVFQANGVHVGHSFAKQSYHMCSTFFGELLEKGKDESVEGLHLVANPAGEWQLISSFSAAVRRL